MARIYHRRGDESISHGGTVYAAAPDGGFEGLPADLERHLLAFPDWETDVQREQRRVREEHARKRDPASQYDEVAAMRAEMRAELRSLGAPRDRDEEIAELRARLAALEGDAPATPAKAPPRARKGTTASA